MFKKFTLLAIIGFLMAACGSGGKFTLNGIPAEYEGKYAYLIAFSQTGANLLLGYKNKSVKGFALPRIANGSVTIPMWKMGITKYTGNDTVIVGIIFSDQDTLTDINPVKNSMAAETTFVNGNATKDWNELIRYR